MWFAQVDTNAELRARQLLLDNLTEKQREDFEDKKHFFVVGNSSGARYRISNGTVRNVDRIDKKGKVDKNLCFGPEGTYLNGDVMLIQKIMLENAEDEVLKIANSFAITIGNLEN